MINNLQLETFIFTTIILMARIIGVFIFAPGFSSKVIPRKFKVLLSLSLAVVLTQYVSYDTVNNIYTLVLYITCELLAGVIIGFTSNLFMQSIQIVGGVLDSLIGTGIFQEQDISGMASSVSSKLIEYTAILLFFISNSHLYLIYTISKDMNFMNLFTTLGQKGFIPFIIEMINFIFVNGVHLALPFVLILLLIDICLGLLNKSFSSFNVFLFSIPVKMLVFLVILFYYIYTFALNFENLAAVNIDLLNSIILFMSPK